MAKVRKRTWNGAGGEIKTAWIADYFDQHGQRHIKTFALKKDAGDWLHATVGQVKTGTHTAERQSLTISEAAAAWLTAKKKLEPSTLASYERHVRMYINPQLGAIKLAKLNTPTIVDFKEHLEEKFSNAKMAAMILISLKSLIKYAQTKGWIAHNPADPVSIDQHGRHKTKPTVGIDIPDRNEVQALIHNAEGRWRPLIMSAIFTGMRSSELRGLRWDDVKFEDREIHVRQRADQYQTIGSLKSASARRDIPISPLLVNTLKEWKLACPHGALGLVFPSGTGAIEHHANILHRGLHALEVRIGMVDAEGKAKYGLHSLRHFAASNWIEAGFSVKKVQSWLGHASAAMTLDVYGHLMRSDNDHDRLEASELAIMGR